MKIKYYEKKITIMKIKHYETKREAFSLPVVQIGTLRSEVMPVACGLTTQFVSWKDLLITTACRHVEGIGFNCS